MAKGRPKMTEEEKFIRDYCNKCGQVTPHKEGMRVVGMKRVKTCVCKICGDDEYSNEIRMGLPYRER